MLTIEYEQSLVETAVFLAVRRDARLECEFHQAIDPLYEILDDELRQREFMPLFSDFFTRLGLDRVITLLLAEHPLISECVDRCLVREAARHRAEAADLFVPDVPSGETPQRTLVIQACPQSFLDSKPFVQAMRRDLLHVADMVDHRFGYRRETFAGPLAHQNLQRDRYRVLWDTYTEGRLHRQGKASDGLLTRLRQAFIRVFGNNARSPDADDFRRVLDAPALTHDHLMAWAREPSLLFDSPPEPLAATASTCGSVH